MVVHWKGLMFADKYEYHRHRYGAAGKPSNGQQLRAPCFFLGDPDPQLSKDCGCRQSYFRCLKFGEPCSVGRDNLFKTNHDCRTCQSHRPADQPVVTRIDDSRLPIPQVPGEPKRPALNASIWQWRGKTLLAYRIGLGGADVFASELEADLQPTVHHHLDLQHPLCQGSREDPRLFEVQNQLKVGFVGVEVKPGNEVIAHQLVGDLDENLKVAKTWMPEYADRQKWEKNWAHFDWYGEHFIVHTTAPNHKVLHVKDGKATDFSETDSSKMLRLWRGGAMRGGASPVRVGDEFWSFFHGARDNGNRIRIYTTGLYAFEAKPPFRPTRVVQEPIQRPPPMVTDYYASVIFCCGAIREGDRWLLSYGVHDRWIEVAEFSHRWLERSLLKL